MATRSRIGVQLKDNSILSAYHHWDGYPSGLGNHLVENYNTRQKASELIDGGDMSTCMGKDGEIEYYSKRGDENVDPQLSKNLKEYLKLTTDCWGEYAYVFVNGKWKCFVTIGDNFGEEISLFTAPTLDPVSF